MEDVCVSEYNNKTYENYIKRLIHTVVIFYFKLI